MGGGYNSKGSSKASKGTVGAKRNAPDWKTWEERNWGDKNDWDGGWEETPDWKTSYGWKDWNSGTWKNWGEDYSGDDGWTDYNERDNYNSFGSNVKADYGTKAVSKGGSKSATKPVNNKDDSKTSKSNTKGAGKASSGSAAKTGKAGYGASGSVGKSSYAGSQNQSSKNLPVRIQDMNYGSVGYPNNKTFTIPPAPAEESGQAEENDDVQASSMGEEQPPWAANPQVATMCSSLCGPFSTHATKMPENENVEYKDGYWALHGHVKDAREIWYIDVEQRKKPKGFLNGSSLADIPLSLLWRLGTNRVTGQYPKHEPSLLLEKVYGWSACCLGNLTDGEIVKLCKVRSASLAALRHNISRNRIALTKSGLSRASRILGSMGSEAIKNLAHEFEPDIDNAESPEEKMNVEVCGNPLENDDQLSTKAEAGGAGHEIQDLIDLGDGLDHLGLETQVQGGASSKPSVPVNAINTAVAMEAPNFQNNVLRLSGNPGIVAGKPIVSPPDAKPSVVQQKGPVAEKKATAQEIIARLKASPGSLTLKAIGEETGTQPSLLQPHPAGVVHNTGLVGNTSAAVLQTTNINAVSAASAQAQCKKHDFTQRRSSSPANRHSATVGVSSMNASKSNIGAAPYIMVQDPRFGARVSTVIPSGGTMNISGNIPAVAGQDPAAIAQSSSAAVQESKAAVPNPDVVIQNSSAAVQESKAAVPNPDVAVQNSSVAVQNPAVVDPGVKSGASPEPASPGEATTSSASPVEVTCCGLAVRRTQSVQPQGYMTPGQENPEQERTCRSEQTPTPPPAPGQGETNKRVSPDLDLSPSEIEWILKRRRNEVSQT